jgi:UDP-N-acetylmuramyl pentapeptide phosphotransferase/UDP-N-acetylglucosamine-1-phosphate transferase
MKKIGLSLLVIGALITAITVFQLTFTTSEKIVDVGELQINQRKSHSLPWPPIVGVTIMAVGAGAYLLSLKRSIAS